MKGDNMKKVELKIKGMHCRSCVMIVSDALTDVKGVKSADVNLEHNMAVISYDEKVATEKQLISAVETEGYKVLR
jgi:copper chaperone CopZ